MLCIHSVIVYIHLLILIYFMASLYLYIYIHDLPVSGDDDNQDEPGRPF